MNVKDVLNRMANASLRTLKLFPVEMLLSLYAFVIVVLMIKGVYVRHDENVLLIPIFMLTAFTLNNLFPQRLCPSCDEGRQAEVVEKKGWCSKMRLLYYLCWLPIIPLWFFDVNPWVNSTKYGIAIVIALLAVLVSRKACDNKRFAAESMRYMLNMVVSMMFSSIAFLLLVAIYYSVIYIFNIDSYSDNFLRYAGVFIYTVAAPLMFFTFTENNIEKEFGGSRFLDILLNYIVTPALIIYSVIVYIYFLKIFFMWSLPRGAVAYMVFIFVMIGMAMKAFQPLLSRRYYDWFYDNFSIAALPALIMFWIGAGYRICQYGFTEWRFYLMLCGIIMTVTVIMFLRKNKGKYMTVALMMIAMFAIFTYIPVISAKNIAQYSQECRVRKLAKSIDLLDEEGRIKKDKIDSDYIKDIDTYNDMCELVRYLNDDRLSKFGLDNRYELERMFPEESSEDNKRSWSVSISDMEIDVSGFSKIVRLGYSNVPLSDKTFKIYYNLNHAEKGLDEKEVGEKEPLLEVSYEDLLSQMVANTGYEGDGFPSKKYVEDNKERFLRYETEDFAVVFSRVTIVNKSDGTVIEYPDAEYLLIK